MIDEAIRKRNEPTNQPNKFFFFFLEWSAGRTPLYREKGRWVRGFPSVAGGGEGGMHRRTFFSFRFVNLWRKEQGKGEKEWELGGGAFLARNKPEPSFSFFPFPHIFPLVILHSSFSRQGIFGHFFGSHYCLAFSFFPSLFFFRLTRFLGMGSKLNYVRGGLVVIPIVFWLLVVFAIIIYFLNFLTVLCLFFSTC